MPFLRGKKNVADRIKWRLKTEKEGVSLARPFTVAQREEFGGQAYALSVRGASQRKIAEELGIARQTVQSLLNEQRRNRRLEHQDGIDQELDALRAAIYEAWRRLENLPVQSASNAGPGLLNSLNALHRTRCEVMGYFAPKRSEAKVDIAHRDFSKYTDEQLQEWHRRAEALEEFEREAGQLSVINGNGLASLEAGDVRES